MFEMKKVGEQIAFFRKKKKYTQEKLAEKLNVSSQAVSKWENGNAMPEIPMLYKMSQLFNCSIDTILQPIANTLYNSCFDYEFIVLPRIPVSGYSGPEWPKSIAFGSLFTALKLFFGLEERRDYQKRQMNDDEEYILQSAVSNICFGYSYAPNEIIRDSFLIYGLDYQLLSRSNYTEDEFIGLARNQIEKGYPVILLPKEYTDIIFATGYSDQCKTLKGLGFLDGDDQKNARIDFNQLNQYAGWYTLDCDMLIVKPSTEKMSVSQACVRAMNRGIELLLNDTHTGINKMQGYGTVIYQNWCDLLKDENDQNADQINCLFPHAFIHYENKLRVKQFFELCINTIHGIDKGLMALAVNQYNEIVNFAGEIAGIAALTDSLSGDELKEKRNHIINMLRRSREQEELALSYIQKAIKTVAEC